ncbi:hypothetical protein BDV93DRAFT_149686 [Ceratobasidium sp. AG-I]|nr:hypothetical protein BDV93DRAFT_149686 [Ceratobasidium sp. AG-I]
MSSWEMRSIVSQNPSTPGESLKPALLSRSSSRTPFSRHSSRLSQYGHSKTHLNGAGSGVDSTANKPLGFFGPADPTTFPVHMKLCLGGVLLFPLWWIGALLGCDDADCWSALWQFRCRALSIISVLVVAGVIVIQGLSMLD